MTLLQFITETNYNVKGTDDTAPALGDEDWIYWCNILNRKKDEMYDDPNQDWASAYSPVAVNAPGTVTTNGTTALVGSGTNFTDYQIGDLIYVAGETVRTILTITDDTHLTSTVAFSTSAAGKTFTRSVVIKVGVQTYNLNRKLLNLTNQVRILLTTGQYQYIDVFKPQERDYTQSSQQAFLSGQIPKTMNLVNAIVAGDPLIGGILMPEGYYRPDDVDATVATAVIPIDDPHWGAMAVAAQVAFNDITYEDKFGDLNGQANVLYKNMARKNRRGTYGQPRITPTNVKRITGFRR